MTLINGLLPGSGNPYYLWRKLVLTNHSDFLPLQPDCSDKCLTQKCLLALLHYMLPDFFNTMEHVFVNLSDL